MLVRVPAKQLRSPLAVYPVSHVGTHEAPEAIVAWQSPVVPLAGTACSSPPVHALAQKNRKRRRNNAKKKNSLCYLAIYPGLF